MSTTNGATADRRVSSRPGAETRAAAGVASDQTAPGVNGRLSKLTFDAISWAARTAGRQRLEAGLGASQPHHLLGGGERLPQGLFRLRDRGAEPVGLNQHRGQGSQIGDVRALAEVPQRVLAREAGDGPG